MISRLRNMNKPMALLFAAGAAVVLLGAVAVASPLVLDWRVIGTGPVSLTSTCHTALTENCKAESTGTVLGQHIGSGTYSLSVTTGNDNGSNPGHPDHATNSNGGKCLPANGLATPGLATSSNAITAASGDIVYFNTVGWLCEEAGSGSSYHYNGTYRIVSGTGRFANVVGGGSLTATFQKSGVFGVTDNVYMKVDGVINF
jgi:hypothetical protein